MHKKILALMIIAGCLLNSCSSTKLHNDLVPGSPKVMKEFRAAWVATVANINWPSKPGLSTGQQKDEAIALMDFLKQHNFKV